jgi:hypothetical protein
MTPQTEMVVVSLAGLIGLSLLFGLFNRTGRQPPPAQPDATSLGREALAIVIAGR